MQCFASFKANSLLCENLLGKKPHSDCDFTTDGKRRSLDRKTDRKQQNYQMKLSFIATSLF